MFTTKNEQNEVRKLYIFIKLFYLRFCVIHLNLTFASKHFKQNQLLLIFSRALLFIVALSIILLQSFGLALFLVLKFY